MPEAAANDEYLTKKELAKLCKCSERTIDRLLEGGDAPPFTRLSPRRIIFPATSARQWLAGRTVGAGYQWPQGVNGDAPQAVPPRRRGRPRKNDTAMKVVSPRRSGRPRKLPALAATA